MADSGGYLRIAKAVRFAALPAALSAALVVIGSALALAVSAQQSDPFGSNWPAGEGREFTGAFCGGCHSLNLVRQQGLSRDRWDELLNWMVEQQNMPPLEGERRATVLDYLAANFGAGQARSTQTAGAESLPIPSPVQGIAREPLGIREGNREAN